MSDYELVISRCKRIEQILVTEFNAEGRGLHEKISSVETRLSVPLVKKIRFIASVRNKLVHQSESGKIDDPVGYERACDEAENSLRALLAPKKSESGTGCLVALAVFFSAISSSGFLIAWSFF